MSSKLISMSLYGDISMYLKGAIENVNTYKQYYPDWDLRIYCAEVVPELDCETIIMGQSNQHSGMFWRFLPLFQDHDAVIVRDTDSRFNKKEAAAVDAWLASNRTAHSMHDHEHHRCYPLFGGMFGIRCGRIPDLTQELLAAFKKPQKRVKDMDWLRNSLWPHIEHDTLHHSSVPLQWQYVPFPLDEPGYFVGQQHTDSGVLNP